MDTLKAEKRSMETKAKRLRREGYVTGNVFGHDIEGSIPVKITKAEADRLLKKKKKGSQIMLDLEGQQYDVLIKEIDFDTLKGQQSRWISRHWSKVKKFTLLQRSYL